MLQCPEEVEGPPLEQAWEGFRGLNPSVQLPKQPKVPPLTCLRIEGIWIRSHETLSEFQSAEPLSLLPRSSAVF